MTAHRWSALPMLRGALALSSGIVIARWLVPSVPLLLVLLALAFALLAIALRARRPILTTLVGMTITTLAGSLLFAIDDDPLLDTVSGIHLEDVDAVGRVLAGPAVRGGAGQERVEYLLALDSLLYRNSVARVGRSVLVRLHDTTPFNPLLLPRVGDRVVVRGEFEIPTPLPAPGMFNEQRVLAARGAEAVVVARNVADVAVTVADERSGVERLLGLARAEVKRFAEQHVRGEEGEIVRALITGEREGIEAETNDAFRRTGTVHILSVSGLHVGLIALALFVLVSWWPNRWAQVALFTLLLLPYVALAGGSAPVVRAAVMAVVFMVARASARRAHPLNVLGAAMLAILLADPGALFEIGFQLSCASVAGIVLILPPLDHRMRRRVPWLWRRPLLRWTAQLLALSLAAQLATLPVVLAAYGTISPIAPFANLLVVPLMNCALGAGMLGALVAPLSDTAAAWFGGSAHVLVWLSRWIAVECSSIEWAQITLPPISVAGSLVLAATTAAMIAVRRWRLVPRTTVLLAAVVIVFVAEHLANPLRSGSERSALLLPWRGGTAVAVRSGWSVHLYVDGAVDTSGAAAAARRAGGVLGGVEVSVVPVHAPWRAGDTANGAQLLSLDARSTLAAPGEQLIFTLESGQAPSPLRFGGVVLLLVPLRFPLDEPMALVERDGRWGRSGAEE